MTITEIVLLVTAIGGLGGTFIALLRIKTEKKKLGADAAQVLSQSAIGLLEPMNAQIDALERRLQNCNREIDTLNGHLEQARQENRELRNQIRDLLDEVRLYRKENPPS